MQIQPPIDDTERAHLIFSHWVKDHFSDPSAMTRAHRLGRPIADALYAGIPTPLNEAALNSMALLAHTNIGTVLEKTGLCLVKNGTSFNLAIGDPRQAAHYVRSHPHIPSDLAPPVTAPDPVRPIARESVNIVTTKAEGLPTFEQVPGKLKPLKIPTHVWKMSVFQHDILKDDGEPKPRFAKKGVWELTAVFDTELQALNEEARIDGKLQQYPHARPEFLKLVVNNSLNPSPAEYVGNFLRK